MADQLPIIIEIRAINATLTSSTSLLGRGLAAIQSGKLTKPTEFDEEIYTKAKPLFLEAIKYMDNADLDIKEAMRAIIKMVHDKCGAATVNYMKEYVVRFMSDIQSGVINPHIVEKPNNCGGKSQ